jgi:SAM-dependent methyltransferase
MFLAMNRLVLLARGVRSLVALCDHSATRNPWYRTETDFLTGSVLSSTDTLVSNSLDLGCGSSPKNPFNAGNVKGIDIASPRTSTDIVVANLFVDPIPFESNTFSYVTAYDFVEHVPRFMPNHSSMKYPFVDLLSEVYRVLLPGGLFYSHTPAFPLKQAFQDPTHLNIITEDTFAYYFCLNRFNSHPWAVAYGFTGAFKLKRQGWCRGKLLTLLEKTDLPACEFSGL